MLRRRFGSLSVKLFVFSFCAVSCLVLLLGVVSQRFIADQFRSQQASYAHHTLVRTDYYVNELMKGLQKDLLFIARDERLYASESEELIARLEAYKLQWNRNIKNLYILKDGGRVYGTSRLLWEIAPPSQIGALYEHLASSESSFLWTEPYFSPVSDYTVTLAAKLPSAEGRPFGGLLAADLDLESILSTYEDRDFSSRESLLMLSRTGLPISVRSPYISYDVFEKSYSIRGLPPDALSHNQASWQLTDEAGRSLLITRSRNNQWGWQVMLLLDEAALDRSAGFMKTLSVWIGVAGLFLSLFVSYSLARYISKPLHSLIRQMKKVSEGDFRTRIDAVRSDEFGVVVSAFNRMVGKVEQLMERLVQIEVKKKQYELKVLQTQIQPHFLYNTLNSISYLAKLGKTDEVDGMITNLSSLLHFHLDKVEEIVAFEEELTGVRRYASLMEMRYPGQFALDCDVEEAALSAPIPKFTLQPLVENAIFHGILPKGELGSIAVTGERSGESVVIRVADDGVGISEERLASLLRAQPSERGTGYYHLGLFSIDERLKLNFGEAFGLRVASAENGGTVVEIRIPARREEERHERR